MLIFQAELPSKWFLFSCIQPRNPKRQRHAGSTSTANQTIYSLFCELYCIPTTFSTNNTSLLVGTAFLNPIRRFPMNKAQVHFLNPGECTCVEHKTMCQHGMFSPPVIIYGIMELSPRFELNPSWNTSSDGHSGRTGRVQPGCWQWLHRTSHLPHHWCRCIFQAGFETAHRYRRV